MTQTGKKIIFSIIAGIAIIAIVIVGISLSKNSEMERYKNIDATTLSKKTNLSIFLKSFISYPPGTTNIPVINEYLGLMIIQYRTSPESTSFAIYDFSQDVFLVKEIGYQGLGGFSSPKALLSKKLLIMHTADESKNKYALSITNLEGNEIKRLTIEDIEKAVKVLVSATGKEITVAFENKTDYYRLDTSTHEINLSFRDDRN